MELLFNINENVDVKLTDTGRAELLKQHKKLKETFPKLGEYTPRKEDYNGWSKWQMHELMNRFGHLCDLGGKLPFDPNIKFAL
tara:strand:- start:788 stop:1036 length:249 start_codon:yes stop_codon:yes gene_type:complete